MKSFYDNFSSLEKEIMNCKKCGLCNSRNHIVIGEGSLNAKLMLIGEAPGYDEDLQGKPFVGKAGKLLDKVLDKVGIKREDIYICNILKCRPPGNRNPSPEEMDLCIDYLRNQVLLIKPKIIVLMGSIALKKIMGKEHGITRERGKWINMKGIYYLPTWHPAAVLRDANKLNQFYNDFRLVKFTLDKMDKSL